MVIREDNRGREERRAISTRPVTPEQLGLAGTQQLAQVQRTRVCPGSSFVVDNLRDAASLVEKLASPKDALSKSLRATLPAKARNTLSPGNADEPNAPTPTVLVRALNKLAKGPSLYDPVRFPERVLSPETRAFSAENPQLKGEKLATFNRLLLLDAYSKELSTQPRTETDWLATSREPARLGAEEFLGANRQYWGIENGTHQRLDCSALEDRLRIRDPNAVAVLGFLHRVSISMYVAWAKEQHSQRDQTYPTWQSDHAANRWIMIRQIIEAPT